MCNGSNGCNAVGGNLGFNFPINNGFAILRNYWDKKRVTKKENLPTRNYGGKTKWM